MSDAKMIMPVPKTKPAVVDPVVNNDPPVITDPVVNNDPPTTDLAIVVSSNPVDLNSERLPCNWHLMDDVDGLIVGKNSVTGTMFNGTREEFSNMLRSL